MVVQLWSIASQHCDMLTNVCQSLFESGAVWNIIDGFPCNNGRSDWWIAD